MSDWIGTGTAITDPTYAAELPVSLAELKAQLRILESDEDSYLSDLIDRATETAERFINNAIAKNQYTYIVENPSETSTIFIPYFPIISIVSIVVTYEDGTESSDMKADAVLLNTNPAQLRPEFTFSTTLDAEYLTITYTAGVGTSAAKHLKQAILLLASEWYENRESTSGKTQDMSWGVKNLLNMSCEYNV